eukprot:1194755-Prorocentrum_minimum.AAC.11
MACLQVSAGYAIAGLMDGTVVVWSTRRLNINAQEDKQAPRRLPGFTPLLSFSAHEGPVRSPLTHIGLVGGQ